MIGELLVYNITISHFLIFTSALFLIGMCGIIMNRNTIINILFSIEIILLSVSLNFVAFSKVLNDITGQIFTIFILAIAGAEAAIGLAILVLFFRNKDCIDLGHAKNLKG